MRVQTAALPSPQRERWQPLRSGFVNLYRYDREEFHFENGRLLLRGNNGTGKSRVLALQLPFLLDGEVNPERLEPDADPSKKVEWNLLMDRYPDRTGYTWIEFGRVDEAGKEHYLTIGCGLSAVEGQAGARRWFFITSQRIGKDLELVSDSKLVISKDRLSGKIGSAGKVYENAGTYRRAVNEALFRLDEYRYASLVNLLIQLRRPQLTRRLEEQELCRALSEALPPVSATLIATVADAFRELESDRTQLDASRIALAAVDEFLKGYRGYAEVLAKRRAQQFLTAHDEYEAAMKELLTAEAECDRSLVELSRLKTDIQRLSVEEHALHSEIAALQQTLNSKDGLSLEQTHREAAEKRKDAETAVAELAEASRFRNICSEEHIRLRALLEQRQLRSESLAEAALNAAVAAGLEDAHRESLDAFEAQEKIDAAIQAQIEKVDHVWRLNERGALAKNDLQRVAAERDQLLGVLDDARERLTTAHAEHQTAITSFLTATSDWTADLTELPLPCDEAFLRSVAEWCDRPCGPNPFAVASRRAVDELMVSFSDTRAYLKQLEKTQTALLNQLETEHESLAASEAADASDESQRRMQELPGLILETQGQLDPVIDAITDLNRRESILRSEVDAAPPDDGVRAIYDYSVVVSRHVESLRNRLTEAEESVSEKQLQVHQITESRDSAALDLGIDAWVDQLPVLKDGIVQYRLALAALWPALESLQEAQTAADWAWTFVEQASAREARQKEAAGQLERRAVALEIARDAAGKAADISAGEVLERLARGRERLEALRIEEKEAQRRYHDTEVAVTRLDERLRSRSEVLSGDTDRRETAASSLRNFASTGMLNLAIPGFSDRDALHWSTIRTVEVAFEVVERLQAINAGDTVWEHHQKSCPSQFTTLMHALSAQGYESSAAFHDDVFVATSVYAGQDRAIDELRQFLFDDASIRQMLFDARAREILENHLAGTVASHLRELILAAEEQVRQMNIELGSRPMSTGMTLRFAWRPADAAPSGMIEARQRLMKASEEWSPSDRKVLGTFLREQIEAAFCDIDSANWQESLADALDYRKWHWFGVERFQDGVWKRLTQRTYGTGSGGEKAVLLTLPHFAAAAAFYRTADPLAPRLIMLDEAFVGIDADMRAKCMGLIHVFDLDFMMTSEREWGCYPTLPGMAIYQLSTKPDIDAVGLTRWVWNGSQRNLWHNPEPNSNEEFDLVTEASAQT